MTNCIIQARRPGWLRAYSARVTPWGQSSVVGLLHMKMYYIELYNPTPHYSTIYYAILQHYTITLCYTITLINIYQQQCITQIHNKNNPNLSIQFSRPIVIFQYIIWRVDGQSNACLCHIYTVSPCVNNNHWMHYSWVSSDALHAT